MRRLLTLLVFVIAAGCAQLQTGSEMDKATDFAALHKFGWLHEVDKEAEDVRLNDPAVRQTVRTAIEQALEAKGYVLTDRQQADFLVTWFGAIEQKIKRENIDHFYAPYGYGTLYRNPVLNTESPQKIQEYEEGTIIIDAVDPESRRLIWRGSGSGRIQGDQPEQTALRNLNRSVTKILDPFPAR